MPTAVSFSQGEVAASHNREFALSLRSPAILSRVAEIATPQGSGPGSESPAQLESCRFPRGLKALFQHFCVGATDGGLAIDARDSDRPPG